MRQKYSFFIIFILVNSILYSHTFNIKKVSATSTLVEPNKNENTYSVLNLFNNSWTSWSEGEIDEGIGTKITVEIDPPIKMSQYNEYIDIVNGYGDLKYYFMNNRVKELRIYFNNSNNYDDIVLEDDWGIQRYSFNKETVNDDYLSKLIFEIRSIYKGTKYNDTCLCEIFIGDGITSISTDPYYSELIKAYYKDILKDNTKIRTDNNGNIELLITKRGRETKREWINPGKLKDFGDVWYRDNIFLSPNLPPIKIIPEDFISSKDDTTKFGRDMLLKCKTINCYVYKNNKWVIDNSISAITEIKSFINSYDGNAFCMRIENNNNRDVISITVYKDFSDDELMLKYFEFDGERFNSIY